MVSEAKTQCSSNSLRHLRRGGGIIRKAEDVLGGGADLRGPGRDCTKVARGKWMCVRPPRNLSTERLGPELPK